MCTRACSAVLVALHASSCVVADARYTSSRHTARHWPVSDSRRRLMARPEVGRSAAGPEPSSKARLFLPIMSLLEARVPV